MAWRRAMSANRRTVEDWPYVGSRHSFGISRTTQPEQLSNTAYRRITMADRLIAAAILTSFLALSLSFPAQALTSAECSAKFKAAQSAGTAGNMKYADFRKAECGTGASATPAAAPAAKPAATPTAQAPAKPPVATGGAVFPTAMSTKYSTESA